MEDINSETVANKLADLVVHFEKDQKYQSETKFNDKEELFYSDDEEELFDSDDDEDEEYLEENKEEFNKTKTIKLKSRVAIESMLLTKLLEHCMVLSMM